MLILVIMSYSYFRLLVVGLCSRSTVLFLDLQAQFRPRVNKVQYPLYVPRFVEVPVSAELFDASMLAQLQAQGSKLQVLSSNQAVGLCEVENMATEFRRTDVTSLQATTIDIQSAMVNAWKTGRIAVRSVGPNHVGPTNMSITTTRA